MSNNDAIARQHFDGEEEVMLRQLRLRGGIPVRDIHYPERYRIDPMMVPMLGVTGGFASAEWETRFANRTARDCLACHNGFSAHW